MNIIFIGNRNSQGHSRSSETLQGEIMADLQNGRSDADCNCT